LIQKKLHFALIAGIFEKNGLERNKNLTCKDLSVKINPLHVQTCSGMLLSIDFEPSSSDYEIKIGLVNCVNSSIFKLYMTVNISSFEEVPYQ
jgi:hypothetical protein